MTSTRRALTRRFLRAVDKIGVTDRQRALAEAVRRIPRDTDSIASKMDPWSTPVMQTLRQFVSDCGFTADLDESLHRHPGPKSEVKPAGLVLSWMAANWNRRTFHRSEIGVALGKIPQHIAEEYNMIHSSDEIWIPPVYSAIQNQQKRLETKIRDGAVKMERLEDTMIEASLRGADLDSIGSVSCDTLAFEGWHLTQRFDRQAEVNKKVRDHYRALCGRDLPAAEMDMSSPELIAAARDLGIILGPDGRVLRTDNDPDSRSGHKSGTPKRPERGFIGFESTKLVATCSHTYDPKTGAVTFGPAVSPYVLASHLAPANTNVGPIGAGLLPQALKRATNIEHVLADGGLTQKKDSFNARVFELGLQLHMTYDSDHVCGGGEIVNIVTGKKKQKTHTVKVHCGELFHINTPKRCLTPPEGYFALDRKPPTQGETEAEREAREERNNQRTKTRAEWLTERRRWKYDIHQRLGDGRLQFICPFHAGKLWCNEVPPSPKLRDGAGFVVLPEGTTKCCNGTFIASLEDLVRIGHQEPAYFSPEHVEVYARRIPVEGRFGTDQENGAYAPRSCRAARLEPHAIASLIFDAIGNLQLTMNKEIDELYELVDNYRGPANGEHTENQPADDPDAGDEPADAPAAGDRHGGEPANSDQSDHTGNEHISPAAPPATHQEPRSETTIDNNPDRDHRAPAPPRAPP